MVELLPVDSSVRPSVVDTPIRSVYRYIYGWRTRASAASRAPGSRRLSPCALSRRSAAHSRAAALPPRVRHSLHGRARARGAAGRARRVAVRCAPPHLLSRPAAAPLPRHPVLRLWARPLRASRGRARRRTLSPTHTGSARRISLVVRQPQKW